MIGQTISHYKILEKLGEGGMGVVYKAQDTKLDRTVAIKFLSPQFVSNETERTRFLHEARAASALDHPNICTFYELDQTPEGNLFIAMAYYEGQTLKEKIAKRPLPLDETVDIALGVASGLSKAHEKKIVHRDIKSENVMITTDAIPKIMDFGLAHIIDATKITKTGATLGTVPYMSPEQTRGETVDHRADIWSFGAVLYEMITGQTPFKSAYNDAIVYMILNQNPEPVTSLRSNVPMELERIIGKCLEKNAADRYQHLDELIVDLRHLKRESTSQQIISQPGMPFPLKRGSTSQKIISQPQMPFTSARRKFILPGIIVSIALVLAIVTVLKLYVFKPSFELNPNMTFRTIQMPHTVFQYPGLSEDGNWIVFPAQDENKKWDLYWMHKSGGEARRVTFDSSLAPPDRFLGADISPDGSQIAYNRVAETGVVPDLCVVSSNGGVGRKIASLALGVRWNPDGSRIGFITFFSKFQKIRVSSVRPDGTDERVDFIDSLGVPNNISFGWSPDGQSIAWIRGFKNASAELITHNLRTNQENQLTFDGKQLDEVFWTRQSTIVYSSTKSGNTNLWSIPADGGEAVQITKGSGPDLGMKLSADGKTLLYYQNQTTGNIWLSDGQATNLRQLTSDDRSVTSVSVSPDRKSIAFAMNEDDADFLAAAFHLYVMDREGRGRRQLTFSNEVVGSPQFSPDGRYVAYLSRGLSEPDDSLKVNVFPLTGSSSATTLRLGFQFEWINESELSVFHGAASYRVPLTGGVGTKLMEDSLYALPLDNGKIMVYRDTRIGRVGLWSLAANSRTARRLTTERENALIVARFAYFFGTDRNLWKVSLMDGRRERIPGTLPDVASVNLLSISPDGKEIVFVRRQSRGKLVMIENLIK